jgi:hypothetical protein
VNGQCAGVGFAYRTDQPDILAWILEKTPAATLTSLPFPNAQTPGGSSEPRGT